VSVHIGLCVCAAFRSNVHLLLWGVDYFVRAVVTVCLCITVEMHGVKTVSRGVLVDVVVPSHKDNYQRWCFLYFHLISHHLHLVVCLLFILIIAGVR
jgi:hypothetical protein